MTKHRPQVAQTLGEFVIRPQVPFFDKNGKKKDSPCVFVLLFTACLFASRAIWNVDKTDSKWLLKQSK